MKYNVIDYKTDGDSVAIVSFKGYNSNTDLPAAGEGVGRVVVESVEDLRSLGAPVLNAVFEFKAKKSDVRPAEHDEMAEAVWAFINPPPRSKTEKISGQKDLQSSTDDGNSSSVAGETGANGRKDKMKTKAKAKKAAKKVAKAKKTTGAKGPRGEKTLAVKDLLSRKSGCTRKDILDKTGWPAVSVQAMARACGLKLRKEKEKGKATRYYGS